MNWGWQRPALTTDLYALVRAGLRYHPPSLRFGGQARSHEQYSAFGDNTPCLSGRQAADSIGAEGLNCRPDSILTSAICVTSCSFVDEKKVPSSTLGTFTITPAFGSLQRTGWQRPTPLIFRRKLRAAYRITSATQSLLPTSPPLCPACGIPSPQSSSSRWRDARGPTSPSRLSKK